LRLEFPPQEPRSAEDVRGVQQQKGPT
jgi:hypothetical protein